MLGILDTMNPTNAAKVTGIPRETICSWAKNREEILAYDGNKKKKKIESDACSRAGVDYDPRHQLDQATWARVASCLPLPKEAWSWIRCTATPLAEVHDTQWIYTPTFIHTQAQDDGHT
ncbi:hypothetical protein H257_09476 [Aphanomyces astaci]|uniref:Uncharacterized protein n=1 Tax=Aphanomyces astaci TaxID=112090 RepID=W4G9T4_APHAT|nr:hypothetical protein H257_09476 [Aphanomyces astaci]ETV76457.1 hypothetical protein H257_09476 [Aphanomyces astaci]|eukprot:XP_009834002.1 hypothetical protein H257_09476 [Aphanomyces astaci]